jgi:hypothetical protein
MTRTAIACALVALPALAPCARAAPCTANVHARVASDQTTSTSSIKVFAVDVDTDADCAKVYVDATVTERLFNGEEITSTKRGSRKVSAKSTTFKVNLRIAPDSTLTDWKFQVASCVVCGTE